MNSEKNLFNNVCQQYMINLWHKAKIQSLFSDIKLDFKDTYFLKKTLSWKYLFCLSCTSSVFHSSVMPTSVCLPWRCSVLPSRQKPSFAAQIKTDLCEVWVTLELSTGTTFEPSVVIKTEHLEASFPFLQKKMECSHVLNLLDND